MTRASPDRTIREALRLLPSAPDGLVREAHRQANAVWGQRLRMRRDEKAFEMHRRLQGMPAVWGRSDSGYLLHRWEPHPHLPKWSPVCGRAFSVRPGDLAKRACDSPPQGGLRPCETCSRRLAAREGAS